MPRQGDEPPSMNEQATLRDAPASKAGRFRVGNTILGRYTVVGELGQGGMGGCTSASTRSAESATWACALRGI